LFLLGFLPPLLSEENPGNKQHKLLWAGCPSGHPTNSVNALNLKETESADPNHGISHTVSHFFIHYQALEGRRTAPFELVLRFNYYYAVNPQLQVPYC